MSASVQCQGLVIVVETNGDWLERLRALRGDHRLSRKALRQVSTLVGLRPLEKRTEEVGEIEYGPVDIEGDFTLFYANHPWFPAVWLVRPFQPERVSTGVLSRDTLGSFYKEGLGHYKRPDDGKVHVVHPWKRVSREGAIFAGFLPVDHRIIAHTLPSNLRTEYGL